jgi:hypothetical protein
MCFFGDMHFGTLARAAKCRNFILKPHDRNVYFIYSFTIDLIQSQIVNPAICPRFDLVRFVSVRSGSVRFEKNSIREKVDARTVCTEPMKFIRNCLLTNKKQSVKNYAKGKGVKIFILGPLFLKTNRNSKRKKNHKSTQL